MELEYEPREEDLLALAHHQVATSPVVHQRLRRRHLALVVAFSLLAVGLYVTLLDKVLSMTFAILATISLIAYPSLIQWRLQRELPRLVRQRATPASYAARKLRALPDGLEQTTAETQSKVAWAMVNAVFETSKHTFISIDGTYSIVIPRERTAIAAYISFMDALRGYRTAAAQQLDGAPSTSLRGS